MGPAYVEALAIHALPTNEDFLDFIPWSQEEMPGIVAEILGGSGIEQDGFVATMQDWLGKIQTAEHELNQKTPPSESGGHTSKEWPPLPGVTPDLQCTSVFDANDLAIRGRKSVLKKQFYMPLVYPQVILDPKQQWAFGQKIEYLQEWRHEGFTLGELISSLSLLPNEELTIEVSSWQRTKTEITEETDTEERQRMEREQRRTDEESCINEAASSNGWTLSASGSVSYGPASASLGASATGSTSERSEQTARQISEATTKATHEVSLRRAIKMTQSAEAGSESRTTRRIRNPNTFHTLTFNFFQIVKLFNVQLRVENDAPVILLPGLFPAFYTDGTPVRIPYWLIEGFTSPALFLTQFFEVDRDLSQEIHGFALRVRIDAGRNAAVALAQLAQALVVATKYLLKLDPAAHLPALTDFVLNYASSAQQLRSDSAAQYGKGRGRSEQVTTPGIYADSLLGRCSAGEDTLEAAQYVNVMREYQEMLQLKAATRLMVSEAQRRGKLLEQGVLDPFETEGTPE